MTKSRIAAAAALLAVAGAANAGSFSVTPTIVSDYDWRGLDQTIDKDPAFQLGGTYSFDSGFYVGAWGSNVDWGTAKPDIEIDYYAGFAGGDSEESFGYDIGFNYYTYPSASSANFGEFYAGITKGIFGAKAWYTWDFGGSKEDAIYLEGNVTYPLQQGFALTGHVGYQSSDYYADDYFEYSAGVTKALGNFTIGVKYLNSNDLPGAGRNAIVGSIATTLPWSAE
jgi:uncharacterized protein (TIGR02001 family)